MAGWFAHGIAAGIRTTRFPRRREEAAGVTPGLPQSTRIGARAGEVASRCPTGALVAQGEEVAFDPRRCIHCYRCVRGVETPVRWSGGYEWTLRPEGDRAGLRQAGVGEVAERPFAFEPPFRRSINILVMDAGDCGACLSEVRQLTAPQYNLHRLGFFITPTPRNADLLLVVGPVTDAMRHPLLSAWEAMPTPKRILAVGACALTGSIFGPSFVSGAGVGDLLPVDLEVPGSPPPPLAILHALLVLSGRLELSGSPGAGTMAGEGD